MVASSRPSRTVSACGPPTARANSTECRSSSTSDAASLDAAPSTPSPTGTPASRRSRVRQMPAPSRALDDGQCATPVPEAASAAMARVVEVDAVREPHVRAQPAQRLDVLDRRAAEPLAAERLLVDRSPRGGCAAGRPCPGPARRPARAGRRSPRTASTARRRSRSIESGDGSWWRSIAAAVASRIASISSTTWSGGSPPATLAEVHRAAGRQEAQPDRRAPPRSRRRAGRRRRRGKT